MPLIENTAVVPTVAADFHLLEIEDMEAIEGTKYGEPDVPETRIKMTLGVRTPGVPQVSFVVWMSAKLTPKATLGGIVLAVLGFTPTDPRFNTDVLIGRRFRHMTAHADGGWPKLVPGTAAPEKRSPGDPEPPL